MEREEAKQHIKQIRQDRFWLDATSRKPSDNPLMAMLCRALNQLATGIFEHAHHYVFELTQNADDNNYPDHADRFSQSSSQWSRGTRPLCSLAWP